MAPWAEGAHERARRYADIVFAVLLCPLLIWGVSQGRISEALVIGSCVLLVEWVFHLATYVHQSGKRFIKDVFVRVVDGDYMSPIFRLTSMASLPLVALVGLHYQNFTWLWVIFWISAIMLAYRVAWYEFVLHTPDYHGPNFAAVRNLLDCEYRTKRWLRPARWVAAVGALTFLLLAHVDAPLGFVLTAGIVTALTLPIVSWLEMRLYFRFMKRSAGGE